MLRANRYILPGHTYHVTHRCHGRKFLLRFAVHRTEYRRRLRAAVKEYDVSLLACSITSNHTHLLINSDTTEALSAMMQKLEGEFAENYRAAVIQALERGQLAREPVWTESIAVGSESFVADVAAEIWNREELDQFEGPGGRWILRETGEAYTTQSSRHSARQPPQPQFHVQVTLIRRNRPHLSQYSWAKPVVRPRSAVCHLPRRCGAERAAQWRGGRKPPREAGRKRRSPPWQERAAAARKP